MAIPGGLTPRDPNDPEIISIGYWAVDEYNKEQNGLPLKFERVLLAASQVVSGVIYYLTLEAKQGKKSYLYQAKVWDKPWLNFRKLEYFYQIVKVPSLSNVDDTKQESALLVTN